MHKCSRTFANCSRTLFTNAYVYVIRRPPGCSRTGLFANTFANVFVYDMHEQAAVFANTQSHCCPRSESISGASPTVSCLLSPPAASPAHPHAHPAPRPTPRALAPRRALSDAASAKTCIQFRLSARRVREHACSRTVREHVRLPAGSPHTSVREQWCSRTVRVRLFTMKITRT